MGDTDQCRVSLIVIKVPLIGPAKQRWSLKDGLELKLCLELFTLLILGLFVSECDHQIGWLVLKGISEYADSTVCSSEKWKTFASVMAASVAEKILSDPDVFQEWNHYQGNMSEQCLLTA